MVKKLTLWLSVAILALSVTGCDQSSRDEKRLEYIEIINEGMISIVKLEVKRNIYTFLLDSGSPISIIDSTLAVNNPKIFKIQEESTMKNENYGFVSKRYTEIMDVRFYLHNFKSTQEKIYYHTQEHVDGVLGMDFLIRNKSVVNFEKAVLSHMKKIQ